MVYRRDRKCFGDAVAVPIGRLSSWINISERSHQCGRDRDRDRERERKDRERSDRERRDKERRDVDRHRGSSSRHDGHR